MKKLFAILLALALIFAMSTTAFADETETVTLTITGTTGHIYDIYQIFTGDVANEGDETVLSNVKYGANYYPATGKTGDAVPAKLLEDFANSQDLADILDGAVKGDPIATVNPEGTQSTVTVDVAAGYYMIVDASVNLPAGQTKSPIILQVLETVTIASKHASITSEKKVDDKNDSNTSENDVDWQDAADYDIGDDVPFQLSVTLPSTLKSYDSYELTFHDKQDAGFEYPENFKVYILKKNGVTEIPISEATEGTSGYQILACTSDACEFDGCSFTVKVGDINELYGQNVFEDGDKIIVEYTAELNENANIGELGNENGMYVCHPDGHTPEDFVTVLTYELKVNKIDGASKNALSGAGFTLYKWIEETQRWDNIGEEIKGDAITSFAWTGIDGGQYKLEETTTPAGYNTIADIEFVIDSTHKTEWIKGGNTAFEDLIAKDPTGTTIIFADRNADGVEDGKLEGDIENYKGTVLPETGAQGTFFLITGSALLVMVAAVFMITRKKMSIYED